MSVFQRERQVVILGASGTGLLMAESILRAKRVTFLGFLDDNAEKQAHGYCGFSVLGNLASWTKFSTGCFLTSLYGPKKNPHFFELLQSLRIPESRFITIVDPSAIVMPKASVGLGTYIGPATVLEPTVCLGSRCAMLGNVYVSHDCRLGDYVVCANSVSIAGGVSIGDVTFIGANATIREHTRIGSSAVIGMGSIVLEDVADGQIVVGNPARPIEGSSERLKSFDSLKGRAR